VLSFALCLLSLVALGGCRGPTDPPSWPQGGASLAFAQARWDRPGDDPVELGAQGQVTVDGELIFSLDRVGRIVDDKNEPVAILLPDGRVAGPDNVFLGQVGVTNAAPPWSDNAWVAVMPDGSVTYFEAEGDRESLGVWRGCKGPALRACTLVTHLFTLREHGPPRSDSGPRVGIGIGVGF
jgi:hypothetical protein